MSRLKLLVAVFILTLFTLTLAGTSYLYSAPETANAVYFGTSMGYNITEKHTEFSLLAGYDRHFEGTPQFTLGLLMEGIFAEHFNLMFGVPIGFYPFEQIKLWLAPCYAFNMDKTKDHSDEPPPDYSSAESIEHIKFDNQFMLKFGGGYKYHFHNTNFTLIPFIESTLVGKEFIIGFGVKCSFYF